MDTATAGTAVALRLADGSISQARDDPPAGGHPGHATRLLGLAAELLEGAGIGWGEVQRIAVGVGPGTFTGLRVGVASARGLAQSLAAQLVGVSSLQALAAVALEHGDAFADGGRPDAVLAVIDARRGEVFAAVYERGGRTPAQLCVPRALAPEDLEQMISKAAPALDARSPRWLAVGDGAKRFREQLQRTAMPVPGDSSPLHLIDAGSICRLGALAEPAGAWQEILPDYRRRPDAELALEAAASGKASEP